jgi:hypothetical protein
MWWALRLNLEQKDSTELWWKSDPVSVEEWKNSVSMKEEKDSASIEKWKVFLRGISGYNNEYKPFKLKC